jgi:glycosyltransferase involved in cell wall biosynthesis
MSAPSISVVVTTYENPRALDAVLRSLSEQSDPDFEIVVADDGSEDETAAVVDDWNKRFGDRLRHVRQPHEGARVARTRNLGAEAARGEHVAFLDGDSVPRRQLVQALRRSSVPGWFAATYRFDLPPELTSTILDQRLALHRWGLATWARRLGRGYGSLMWLTPRDRRRVGRSDLPDFSPPLNNYGFVFVSRADLERVNGYDMRYRDWGGEDHDLGIRLRRLGLRCGWPGPSGALFHLWHESRKDTRSYKETLRETARSDRVEAISGLRELAAELDGTQVNA